MPSNFAEGAPGAIGIVETLVDNLDRNRLAIPLAYQPSARGEFEASTDGVSARSICRDLSQLSRNQCRQTAVTALLQALGD